MRKQDLTAYMNELGAWSLPSRRQRGQSKAYTPVPRDNGKANVQHPLRIPTTLEPLERVVRLRHLYYGFRSADLKSHIVFS